MDASAVKTLGLLLTLFALIAAGLLRRATSLRSSGVREITGGRETINAGQKRIHSGRRSLRMSLLMLIVALPALFIALRLLLALLGS